MKQAAEIQAVGIRAHKSRIALGGLLLALLLGAFTRFLPGLIQPWAPNDGGLFLSMARAIEANHLVLPARVFYPTANGDTLPFCYPPLGFYFAVLAAKLGVPLEAYFRFAPALWSVTAIWAFWRLAGAITEDERRIAGATVAYALLPQSLVWNVMGGGVSRGAAFVFVFLALEVACRLWRGHGSAKHLVLATVFLAAALACHLERFHFAAVSLVLFWLVWGRSRRSFGQLLAMFAGAALLTAPWWGLCLSRFGLEPFRAAMGAGGSAWGWNMPRPLWVFGEPFLPLLTAAAVGGIVILMRRREALVPLWMLAVILLEIRSPRVFMAVPMALAIGATTAALWPKAGRKANVGRVCLLGFGVLWGLLITSMSALRVFSLTRDELDGMAWVKQHTPADAAFLVMPVDQWATDRPAEWFPALAERRSLSTVQGSEWLRGQFQLRVARHEALSKADSFDKLISWLREENMHADYVWVSERDLQPRATVLKNQLALSLTPTHLVYRNQAVSIYKLVH